MNITQTSDFCTGCGVCAAVCPSAAVKMQPDAHGFLRPVVDDAACIDCGLCTGKCPVSVLPQTSAHTDVLTGYAQDGALLPRSSSGAIFPVLAAEIIRRGGLVFGAAFDRQFHVVHTATESVEALSALCSSKYVQSCVSADCYAQIETALAALGSQEAFDAKYPDAARRDPLTLAVGDGNHSLATAKACWEELKKTLTPEQAENHPARWCLAEVCNVHSPAIEIEPIHRVLFNVDCAAVLLALITWSDENMAGCCFGGEKKQPFTLAGPHMANVLSFEEPTAPLTVGTIDEFIEYYLERHPEGRVDYVHDEPAVRALCKKGAVAFLMPPFAKSDLFKGVVLGGVLPRKTFSMGHAEEKRYYIECRKITE